MSGLSKPNSAPSTWKSGGSRILLLLSGLLFLSFVAFALNPSRQFTQYRRVFWSNLNGLPQRGVNALAQSADGYMWLGTQEGLARFDGVRFTTFEKANTPALPGNIIMTLAAGGDGALWGSTRGGLFRYADGRMQPVPASDTPCAIEPSTIWADAQKEVWVGAKNGTLCKHQDGKWRTVGAVPNGDVIRVLRRAANGTIWLGTASGLWRFDGGWRQYTPEQGLPSPSVRCILERKDGTILVGTAKGIGLVDGATVRLWGPEQPALRSVVSHMLEDRHGNLWVANWPSGVWRLTPGGELRGLDQKEFLQAGVQSLFEDREGNLWIGTAGDGVMILMDTRIASFGATEGVTDRAAWSILQDRNDDLWITTRFDGLRKLDSQGLPLPVPESLLDRRTGALLETANGDVWVGVANGVAQVSGQRSTSTRGLKTMVTEYHFSQDPEGRVTTALVEGEAGMLWVGTADRGLLQFHKGSFTLVPGVCPRGVKVMLRDGQGTLWASEVGGGLYFLAGEGWKSYHGLEKGAPVLSMLQDRKGQVWITSEGNGIRRLDNNGRRLDGRPSAAIGTGQGLCSDQVYWMLDDGQGSFWMSSSKGIGRVSAAGLQAVADGRATRVACVLHDVSDGMRNPEGTGGIGPGARQERSGRIWFPTTQGVVAFHPQEMKDATLVPPPILEAAEYKGGQPFADVVPKGFRDVEFRYTAPAFANTSLLRFRSRLAGYDTQWLDDNRRVARYTNLPPGQYKFQVQTANPDGVWGEPIDLKRFEIPRNFTETGWFLILMAATMVLLVAVGVNLRTRQIRLRQTQLEELVAARTAEARNAAKAKSEFLANMSHEIRTPMSATVGTVELLMAMELQPEAKEHLNVIRASGEALLALINDILDYSKIEAGKLELERRRFSLVPLLEETLALVSVQAHVKGLTLEDLIDPAVPETIASDQTRLRQILLNLFSNAIKFTPRGTVQLQVSLQPAAEGRPDPMLHFQVKDTGIGMSAESVSRLFREFTQADSSTTRRFGGTGLGLAISRKLTETFGGKIWVDSQEGAGSTFHFTIPAVEATYTHQAPPTEPATRVLFLLAQPETAAGLQSRLARLGRFEVVDAELSQLATISAEAQQYSLAFVEQLEVDVVPSGSSGAAAEALRATRSTTLQRLRAANPAMRIIEIGAKPDASWSRGATDALLTLPLRTAALQRAIGAQPEVPEATNAEAGEKAPLLAQQLPLNILLAEDNRVNQKVILSMLQSLGYNADLAENGLLALEAMQKQKYDLVFMDVHMPELDGLEATKRAYATLPVQNRPVIFALTAGAFDENRAECLAAGMQGFLAKPVRIPELAAAISSVPQLQQQSHSLRS